MDAYLEEGVWIVTADIEGFNIDKEDHQDPRELKLFSGNFVREPKVARDDDPPVGYKWVQAGPFRDGAEVPGLIGIVPLKSIKRIEKNALRIAHDNAGATATNIVTKAGVKKSEKGDEVNLLINRTIEPTDKIGRKYANPKDEAKKFVKGFKFEDGEFLQDTEEPLINLCGRMIKIDGSKGRVKPRNLQLLEYPWGLPNQIPTASSGAGKKSASTATPGKQGILGTTDKTDPRYHYSKGMDVKDFKIVDLRAHCVARGYAPAQYGKTKVAMLATLVKHDAKKAIMDKAMGKAVAGTVHGLPMRRVLADVSKKDGPPKMPPFFATEIVLEIGKGDADDPATWVKDYEGRLGRIDESNLEPIIGAWGIELDIMRWNQILNDIRKDVGYGKPPKAAKPPGEKKKAAPAKKPAPAKKSAPAKKPAGPQAAEPAPGAADKKRPAEETAEPPGKKVKQ